MYTTSYYRGKGLKRNGRTDSVSWFSDDQLCNESRIHDL